MDRPIRVSMHWEGDERFAVVAGDHHSTLDGEGQRGLSPMQHLAVGVTGCMAIDIAHILGKMRTPADAIEVNLDTRRAPEPPRRFTGLDLEVVVTGSVPQDNLDRAVQLSRDKYCSAWHTFRDDIDLRVTSRVIAPD